MKIRIKSFNGELAEYLTEGSEYDAFLCDNVRGAIFTNYFGNKAYCSLDNSCHLGGGSWEIVDDNITDNVADIKYHVSPLTKVSCHHQWVNADSIGNTEHQYFCAYCSEKKTEAFGVTNEV